MPYPNYLYGGYQGFQSAQQPNYGYMQTSNQQSQNNAFNPQPTPAQSQYMPTWANKIYVTNVQDALSRFLSPNTSIVYTVQDEKTEVEVFADAQGKKTYQIYERKPYVEDKNSPTVSQNTDTLENSLTDLEKGFNQKIDELNAKIEKMSKNDTSNFATINDINALKEDFNLILKSEINALKAKITSTGAKKNVE